RTTLLWTAVADFAIFCGLSGAMYLFNDVADAARDRLHPTKRLRPIASGRLSPRTASVVGALVLAGSLAAAFRINVPFGLVALAYGGLLIAYSVWLSTSSSSTCSRWPRASSCGGWRARWLSMWRPRGGS